jgi:tripartite-type tricarboxylate transporter receptor subunit TctC
LPASRATLPFIVGHPEGSKNAVDFVKQAKAQNVSIGGNGQFSITGLQARLMTEELDMKVNWVNYGGAAQSLTALAGKHLDAVATMTDSATPLIKADKIIPLIIFAKTRHPKFPTVPVPDELGFKFPIMTNYISIVGPPGMDKERVKILENAILKAGVHPDYVVWRDKVSTAEPALASAKAYRTELDNFGKMVEDYKRFFTSD